MKFPASMALIVAVAGSLAHARISHSLPNQINCEEVARFLNSSIVSSPFVCEETVDKGIQRCEFRVKKDDKLYLYSYLRTGETLLACQEIPVRGMKPDN